MPHTPGPWIRKGSCIVDAKNEIIAQAHHSLWRSIEETDANGDLIAAAPCLLESLTNLLGECQVWITTSLMNHTDWKQYVAVRTAAEAAIKKARGKQ
jgi:hypothetical protein